MTTSITYEGQLRCAATHNQSGTVVETDAPTDNRGRGESFSPTDSVCMALGTCMATTMAIKATDKGIELKGTTLDVQKYMSTDAPRRIVKIDVIINFPPLNLAEKDQQLLENTAHGCPVARSLHPDVEQNIVYNW